MNMKMYIRRSLTAAVLGLLVLAQCVPVARADGFQRIAANRLDSSSEIFTTSAPSGTPAPASGGFIIYNHPVVAPDDSNVLFVTIHATGDTHGGARLMLSCLIDDVACDPNSASVPLAPAGWVTIQRHRNYNLDYVGVGFPGDGFGGAGDLHDNNISYSWCGAISAKDESRAFTWEDDPPYWNNTHNIKIKLASGVDDTGVSGNPASPVFLDSVHIYVDAGHIRAADRCTAIAPGT